MIESRRFRQVFAAFALFTLFAGDVWRYSIGWPGFGIIAALIVTGAILILVRRRHEWHIERFPIFLLAFLALTLLSIAWSFYPGASALGVATTWGTIVIGAALAVAYSWNEILAALGTALRFILGLSLLFEFVVAAFIRHPVLPIVPAPGVDYAELETIPKLMYWSRDLLFEGGKIQGIVGNSSLLAFVALAALLVFAIQLVGKTVHRFWGGFWLLVAVGTIALTRSPTIYAALVGIALVLGVVLLLRHTSGPAKTAVYAGSAILAIGTALVATLGSAQLLSLVGKSADLTGRVDIWNAVIALAQERPAFGWGWVSFWAPWVAPFDNLAFAAGVRQLHAHNAWLDVWLQLGVVGLVVFGMLVLTTSTRSLQFAISSDKRIPGQPGTFSVVSLLPLLLLVALLVQSVFESRLLIEYGMVMLTIIAIKTKLGERVPLRAAVAP